jgi:hypothetical protein
MIQFLVAPDADISGSDILRRCNEVLTKYSRNTWNFASSTRDLLLSLDSSGSAAEVEHELGISPTAFREIIRRAIRMYVDSATAVCTAETQLEEKLKRLDTILRRVDDLMFLEPTEALEQLETPIRTYLETVLNKITIHEEYNRLIHNYKKFAVLKGLVSLANFQRSAAPTCNICMAKEVTHALTPCGHTYCEDCLRNQNTSCYNCRTQIRDRIRLYFS